MKRVLLALLFVTASCGVTVEGEHHLKGSCAISEKSSGFVSADPICYKKMKREKDPVLKYYNAKPFKYEGETYYEMVRKPEFNKRPKF